MKESQKADAIIVAAGSGTRFGAPKQFAELNGIPLYQHSLKTFAEHPLIAKIILVVSPDDIDRYEAEIFPLFFGKKIEIAIGGATRQDSVSNGMQKLEEIGTSGIVLVHDGARPFVSKELISNIIGGVEEFGSALAAIPLVDTLKQSSDGFSTGTIPRASLWRAQTPQGAKFELLKKALVEAHHEGYTATDEAELLERIGVKPLLVTGDEKNVKITYAEDLRFSS
ncbi:MAG: 2-C-methyl-D-erythritol 4-phosphate cytidylyltransferase [Bacteroidota bacterium]|nr:2-C-methyl-D-erythritol 4-phosphate cytidylyltransferase [Bacteroidota bacterium]MDP4231026.1 2-C-methyl-D-erythritol 4-phosphate cytidylyltransferase [Bacteroidota bacterium]MDP4235715.1 2-C-methyl-D-erythritol 4-phosphate cytidylyltransferase [Bacteroidota bacterium]